LVELRIYIEAAGRGKAGQDGSGAAAKHVAREKAVLSTTGEMASRRSDSD
jgi:hypothetical protein